ncbi:hypothetical protein D3C72_1251210 [compost metagenome]
MAPFEGLSVEVVEVPVLSSGEETGPHVLDGPFDSPLLVASRHRDGLWLETVMSGQLQQSGMEPDGLSVAFQDCGLQVVIQELSGDTPEILEGVHMAPEEVGHPVPQVEAKEDPPGPGEDHDESQEPALGVSDADLAEVGPVYLSLLAGESSQAHVGFCRGPGAVTRDDLAEVALASGIAPGLDHVEEALRGEGGKVLQSLLDEGEIGVGHGGLGHELVGSDAPSFENAADGGMVDAKLGGDGVESPLLGVVEAKDLSLLLLGNHGFLLLNVGRVVAARDEASRTVRTTLCSRHSGSCSWRVAGQRGMKHPFA